VIFLEAHARAWLIVHAIVGVALVGSATHLVIWTRSRSGLATRWRGVRRHATITLILYVAAFALGNLLYPSYKVRVRLEYLDEPTAVSADAEARGRARALVEQRRTGVATAPPRNDAPMLTSVARVFDIKEHWVALGLALAAAACVLAWAFDPRARNDEERSGAAEMAERALFCFAVATATCAWIGAIVGLYVSSFRSVGGLG
jgi:hypothetical protein